MTTATSDTSRHAPVPALARRRVALTAFFALAGFLYAGWAVRIPAVSEQVDATPGALGLALLCMSGAAVATMLVTGRLCERFGSRQVTIAAALLFAVSITLPPRAATPLALGIALVPFGVAFGGIDVALNSAAVDLIALVRRPIMPGFHAANSVGSLAGAGVGGLLAPYLTPTRHMLVIAPLALLVTAVLARRLMTRADPPPPTGAAPATDVPPAADSARPGRAAVALLAVIALGAAYSQGALDNWVPLHLARDLGAGPTVAAAGYATVALALTVGRLVGARLLERFGQDRVVVVGAVVSAAGALLSALGTDLVPVFAGLLVTGLGMANIFPVALARAGAIGGPSGIAFAATLGYGGILLAPPTIGFLAEAFGLPVALTVIAPMVALAALITPLVRDGQPEGVRPSRA